MVKTRKQFSVGSTVFAKWPGSGKYFEATVDEVLDFEYKVTFKDGTSMGIEQTDVYVSILGEKSHIYLCEICR